MLLLYCNNKGGKTMKKIVLLILLFIMIYLFLDFAAWRIEKIENSNDTKNQSVEIFKNK